MTVTELYMRRPTTAVEQPLGDWVDGRPHVEGTVASLDRLGYLIAVYESRGCKPTLGPAAAARMTAAGSGWARLAARLERRDTP